MRSNDILFGNKSYTCCLQKAWKIQVKSWLSSLPACEGTTLYCCLGHSPWSRRKCRRCCSGPESQRYRTQNRHRSLDNEVFTIDFGSLGPGCHRTWNFYQKLKMRKTDRSLLCIVSPTPSPRWSCQHPSSPEDLRQVSKPLSRKPQQLTTAGRDKQARNRRNSLLDKFMHLLCHPVQM